MVATIDRQRISIESMDPSYHKDDMAIFTDTIATIEVMLRQEAEYAARSLPYPNDQNGTGAVDAGARSKMAQWCCRVVKFCKLEPEAVSIAMNYTDRACTQDPTLLNNRANYQRVAVTALYTAVKIHAPEAFDPKLMSNLSNGAYSPDDIERQERCLLALVKWRLNPPTAHSFVRQYMLLLNPILTRQEMAAVTQFALQQLDDYVHNYSCCTSVQESELAYCAVLNALEQLPVASLDEKRVAQLGYNLAGITAMHPSSDEGRISGTKSRLISHYQALRLDSAPLFEYKVVRICEPESDAIKCRRD